MKKYILKLFVFLQIVLVFSWFVGKPLFPFRGTFTGKGLKNEVEEPLFWSRANFDGFHYAKIARDGYQHLQQAFFPLYPKLIKFFQPLFKSFVVSGVFLSSVFFILSLWLLAKILKEEGESGEVIKRTLLFLALFPTSFYFLCVYTESLFLFLILLSFWFAGKKKWFWAGMVAGLASYTRLVGIFMIPALLYEYYSTESKRKMKERVKAVKKILVSQFSLRYWAYFFKTRLHHIKNTFFILLSSWGLFCYMAYLKMTTGDCCYFAKIQVDFGAQRTVNKLIMLYQVFWRYLKMIFTVSARNPIYFVVCLELLVSLLFLALLILAWFKFKVRRSWLIFSTLAYVLPTVTGTFSSMPRYVLVCFPCFLILAKLKPSKVFYFLSGLLLLVCSALFFKGYWIA